MVSSPNNGGKKQSNELDESLEGLVDLLLDLATPQIITDSAVTEEMTGCQSIETDVLTSVSHSVNFAPTQNLVIQSQSSEAKPDPETKVPEIPQADIKYIWYYLNNLEHKIQELKFEVDDNKITNLKNRDCVREAIFPCIDEAIHQRGVQDRVKMGAAIAHILPTAILHQIEHSPHSIAKALAPELAVAIQQQIELDSTAISTSLAPQMGDAIKNQIILERDAMVDALYPVIGNTISKYMVEMVQAINERVETAFSLKGIVRKIRAKLKGVSEAEIILQESLGYKIQAVLLIHKASGLVMREIQPEPNFRIDTDMMGGMLTAIRSFVNECMAEPDLDAELQQIEYSASRILLEVAGYCYLAIIVKGEPSPTLIVKIRETLGKIVLQSGGAIANYDGDPTTIPKNVDLLFNSLIHSEPAPQIQPKKFPIALVMLTAAIAISLAIIAYKSHVAAKIEAKTAEALDEVPELSIYRIVPQVDGDKLMLTGRLPNEYLRQKAETVTRQAAPNWAVNNKILAVDVPAEPIRTAGEVKRVAWIYNQTKGTAIEVRHDFGANSVNIAGLVSDSQQLEQLIAAIKQIPGITTVTSTVQVRPLLESRIYFGVNSTRLDSPENNDKLKFVRQFLDRNLSVHLKIIAHTDAIGDQQRNRKLSSQRALVVRQALVEEGINPARLQIQTSDARPPEVTESEASSLSRTVRFEVFIPK